MPYDIHVLLNSPKVGRILFFILDKLLCMIICFNFITKLLNNILCVQYMYMYKENLHTDKLAGTEKVNFSCSTYMY